MPEALLLKSVMDVATKVKHDAENCYKLCKRIDCLEKVKVLNMIRKAKVEQVLVFLSSFRPSVLALHQCREVGAGDPFQRIKISQPEETGRSFRVSWVRC